MPPEELSFGGVCVEFVGSRTPFPVSRPEIGVHVEIGMLDNKIKCPVPIQVSDSDPLQRNLIFQFYGIIGLVPSKGENISLSGGLQFMASF